MVTTVPGSPPVGKKEVTSGGGIAGGARTVKAFCVVKLPEPVVTVIGPVVALVGTAADTTVTSPNELNRDGIPLNRTEVTLTRLRPLISIQAPGGALFGEKFSITGGS